MDSITQVLHHQMVMRMLKQPEKQQRVNHLHNRLCQMAHTVEFAHEEMVGDAVILIVRGLVNPTAYRNPHRWARDLKKDYPNIRCRVGKTGLLVKVGIS